MLRALTNARLIDGTGGVPRPDSTIVIDGSRIVEVSRRRDLGPGVAAIDVGGKTVIPGLIDCHMHHASWGLNLLANQSRSVTLLAAETVNNLRQTLEAGCTTVRDLGGLDAGFRDAVEQGLIVGPRLQTSVVLISPTNGMVDPTSTQGLRSPMLPSMPWPNADGPYALRAKVREVLRAGADVIKIATTGGVSQPRVKPGRQIFTPEEVEAIVDEAHMAGVKVACHALSGPGVLMAVRAGVDSLEHGTDLDDACAAEMAERGTWLVPTFSIVYWRSAMDDPVQSERARALIEPRRRSFERALKAGLRIAMGSDGGAFGYGVNLGEVVHMVEAGMTPARAIQAATRDAAECLGLQDRIGTIEPGKEADLLVLDGDPLADVEVIRTKLALVLKGGEVVGGALRIPTLAALEAAPGAGTPAPTPAV